MAGDEFWDDLKELKKQEHEARVAKNPNRIEFAIHQFELNNIEYCVKNSLTGHIHAWDRNGNLHQYWAGTGKILGSELRGIYNFVKVLTR